MNRIVVAVALIVSVCGVVVGLLVGSSRNDLVAAAEVEVERVKAAPPLSLSSDEIALAFRRRDAAVQMRAKQYRTGAIIVGLGVFAGVVLLLAAAPRDAAADPRHAAGNAANPTNRTGAASH